MNKMYVIAGLCTALLGGSMAYGMEALKKNNDANKKNIENENQENVRRKSEDDLKNNLNKIKLPQNDTGSNLKITERINASRRALKVLTFGQQILNFPFVVFSAFKRFVKHPVTQIGTGASLLHLFPRRLGQRPSLGRLAALGGVMAVGFLSIILHDGSGYEKDFSDIKNQNEYTHQKLDVVDLSVKDVQKDVKEGTNLVRVKLEEVKEADIKINSKLDELRNEELKTLLDQSKEQDKKSVKFGETLVNVKQKLDDMSKEIINGVNGNTDKKHKETQEVLLKEMKDLKQQMQLLQEKQPKENPSLQKIEEKK
jgi:hypothetical protein